MDSAHTVEPSALIWVRVTPSSGAPLAPAYTGTGVLCCAPGRVTLFPSSPDVSSPQQKAAPAAASAHAAAPLAVIWVRITPAPGDVTATGMLLLVVDLSPSWPLVPRPQQ